MTPILGIGTARSGTKSLARILQAQGLDVGHERTTSVPWDLNRKPARYKRLKDHLKATDGDVACWLTQAAPRLLEETGGTVIALKRPKEDTVESLAEHMTALRIRERRAFGPMTFPTYTEGPLEEAWGRYWEDYRERLANLVASYPKRVLCVDTYELETSKAQEAMAEHLGIRGWTHVADAHYNQRDE